jgi:uncharacterized cupin superfamily protein/GNAT superfamily N-acetyltransferase
MNTHWNRDWDKFVGQPSELNSIRTTKENRNYLIKTFDADVARQVGFSRIAPHHVILPKGCRTSSPHAESLEEEFVYVIKGRPHLWLNGFMYQLEAGHAVGFAAGTGIAHTFINNTESDIELLVAGERTKKENLCSFPVNPELEKDSSIWWSKPPEHELGPHSGLPGEIQDAALVTELPTCVVQCFDQPRRKPFHYPGDNETFGEGFRVTDKVGLKALGVWFETLPSGRRSAFPHAHTHEEEFVFVVKGSLTVWMNGFTKTISAGGFAAFPAGTGIAHVLINDSTDDVQYICIGETQNFSDEKISYPLNSLRQNECARKGWSWADQPKSQVGNSDPMSSKWSHEHIRFEMCTESHVQEIRSVYDGASKYFLDVEGVLPDIAQVRRDLYESPPETSQKYFKHFLLVRMNDKPVGILDLHVNYPDEKICYLGLFLLHDAYSGNGNGRKIINLAEDYISRALECDGIRLGVSDNNQCSGFWEKCGFTLTGRTYEHKGEKKGSLAREYQKTQLWRWVP